MRTVLFYVIAAASIFFTTSSDAQAQSYGVGPFVIDRLGTDWQPYEGIVVYLPTGVTLPFTAPSGCASDGGGLSAIIPGTTNPNLSYKTISSTIMAAFLGGKPIKLYFNSPLTCQVVRPTIAGVEVYN